MKLNNFYSSPNIQNIALIIWKNFSSQVIKMKKIIKKTLFNLFLIIDFFLINSSLKCCPNRQNDNNFRYKGKKLLNLCRISNLNLDKDNPIL